MSDTQKTVTVSTKWKDDGLGNMTRQVQKVGKGFEELKKQVKDSSGTVTTTVTKTSTGVNQLTDSFKKLSTGLKGSTIAIAAIGTAIVAVGAALIKGAMSVAKFADEMGEMSQKLGVSTQDLQKLKYVAELSGAGVTELATGFKTLSRNMVDAEMGNKKASDVFRSIGINIKDSNGQLKDANEVFLDAADKISNLKSETEKVAIAQKLFGKSGNELLPVLNQGRDAIKAQQEEAVKLGVVFSDKLIADSDRLRDNMTKLSTGFMGLFATVSGPIIRAFGDAFSVATEAIKGLIAIFKAGDAKEMDVSWLIPVWKFFAKVILTVGVAIKNARIYLKEFASSLETEVVIAINIAIDKFQQLANTIAQIKNLISIGFRSTTDPAAFKRYTEAITAAFKEVDQAVRAQGLTMGELNLENAKKIREIIQETTERKLAGDQKALAIAKDMYSAQETDAFFALHAYELGVKNSELKEKQRLSSEETRRIIAETNAEYLKQLELINQISEKPSSKPKPQSVGGGGGGTSLVPPTDNGLAAIEASIQATKEEIRVLTEKHRVVVASIEAQKTLRSIAFASMKEGLAKETAITNSEYDDRQTDLLEMLDANLISITEYNTASSMLEDQRLAKIKSVEEEIKAARGASIREQMQMYLEMASQVVTIGNNMSQVQINKLDKETEAKKKNVEDTVKNEKVKAGMIEAIDKEAEEKRKKINEQNKTWAIAQAVINGAVAMVKAFENPFPLSLVVAGLVAAATASEIAVIESQKFASGGIVKGRGQKDSQSAMLSPGEAVLTTEQQRRFMAIANGQASPSSGNISINENIVVQGNLDMAAANQIKVDRERQLVQLRDHLKELKYRGQLVAA